MANFITFHRMLLIQDVPTCVGEISILVNTIDNIESQTNLHGVVAVTVNASYRETILVRGTHVEILAKIEEAMI